MNRIRRIKTLLIGLLIWCAGSLILWFVLPYKPKAVLSAPEEMTVGAFSPDFKVLAGVFSPDGKVVATKGGAEEFGSARTRIWHGPPIRLWDVESGKQIAIFPEEGKEVRQILFSANGELVVLESLNNSGNQRTVSIFRVRTGEMLDVIHQERPHPIILGLLFSYCHFTLDGKTILFDEPLDSDGLSKVIKLYDVPTRSVRQTSFERWPLEFSPSGNLAVFSWGDLKERIDFGRDTKVQDLATGVIMLKFPWPVTRTNIAFTPDSKIFVAQIFNNATQRNEVKVWELSSGKELATLVDAWSWALSQAVLSPVFSRNGKRLATMRWWDEDQGTVKIWDTSTWEKIAEMNVSDKIEGHEGTRRIIKAILPGPGEDDFRVELRDIAIKEPSRIGQWLSANLGVSVFGDQVAKYELGILEVPSAKRIMAFNLGEELWPPVSRGKNSVSSAFLSPDGKTMAVEPRENSKSIQLFNIPPDRPIAAIVLWPVLGSLAIFLIGRQIHRMKRKPI